MTNQTLWSRASLAQIRDLLRPVPEPLTLLFVLIVFVQVLQLLTPYVFKEILDTFIGFTPNRTPRLAWLIAATFGLSIVMSAVRTVRDRRLFRYLLALERLLPVRAQAKLMELPLGYHEQQDTGNLITKVQRGTDRFVDLVATCLFEIVPTVLQCLATFGLLLILNWTIALVFIPVVPVYIWQTARINRQVSPLRKARHEGYETAGGQMAETLINVHTVQAFAQEDREVRDHAGVREQIWTNGVREWMTLLTGNLWRDGVITLGRIAVLTTSVILVVRNECTIGSLVLFLSISEQAYYSLYRLSRLFDRAAEWSEAVTRLTTLLREVSTVQEKPGACHAGRLTGAIRFDNVSFSYGSDETLRGVTLDIPAGTTVAFVGPSGCGKTTMVKLLFRHYDPTAGVVLVDGRNLRDLTFEGFRTQMAIVPQEVEIFNKSIRGNIAYANPDATHEVVERAARLANAHDFISGLSSGYDTLVGERGIKLSGGQRQRIGIARALLRDPRILVFDEATSNLDGESEALIHHALRTVSVGRTTIVIAHRLSTVRDADLIVVFQHGRIVETGTHNELIQKSGVYARMSSFQLHERPTQSHSVLTAP
ncbi:MAG: ABC transporter ATP-binding protein [Candidatus Kerfeldbacteria bacterium]|nr:ABC transporter ATP-binding protein [Candidatus Kerfeldbacteria bacterium]